MLDYQLTLSFTQFYLMRRKSQSTLKFWFPYPAGTVGSFAITDKVKNANSLAFVDGIPIFERYFLGDEFTIRGYNVGPLVQLLRLIHSSLRKCRVCVESF